MKPNKSGAEDRYIRIDPSGAGFTAVNMQLRQLITWAYQIQTFQLEGGPDWIASDRFDILARPERAVPATGAFGSAGRNTIIGPGTQQVDASISRDVRLSGNQVVSIQLQATNLFNTVRFGGIDSVVNSPTFGQVVTIRPMRTVQLGVRFRF